DFMLGQHLLVAPVVEQGAGTREVYLPTLPNGAPWLDFFTKVPYASGQVHLIDVRLDQLPLFVRSGSAIPVAAPAFGEVPRWDDPVSEILHF
ncbi:MAG: glycoside hydrolase family 31 protein, partial [Hydrogenophaga sp.]|nr:glycoside hydrolase family 31 protein [Hydrogenophaga sp.]